MQVCVRVYVLCVVCDVFACLFVSFFGVIAKYVLNMLLLFFILLRTPLKLRWVKLKGLFLITKLLVTIISHNNLIVTMLIQPCRVHYVQISLLGITH